MTRRLAIAVAGWLAACGGAAPIAPVPSASEPAPAAPEIQVVVAAAAPVAMRSAIAVLEPYDHVLVMLSSEPHTCRDFPADWKPRPGEVSFFYELAPTLHADGTLAWVRRETGPIDASSDPGSGIPSRDELGPDAVVEPRIGGRVHARLVGPDGAPLAIAPAMTATGVLDAVVCPSIPTAVTGPASGFAEIAGRRYPLTTAILAGGPQDSTLGADLGLTDRYLIGTTLVIPVVGVAVSCYNEYLVGSEIRIEVVFSDDAKTLRHARLTGAQIAREAAAAGDAFTITPAIAGLHGDHDVELAGSGQLRSGARLDPSTARFLSASGPPYAVKLGGRVHVLDCRGG